MKEFDSIIIGGGFFGMYIAEFLALQSKKVLLLEMDDNFMKRASLTNQARVHQGYHYPRSLLTALRSRQSFPIFCEEFADAIVDDFEKYYAIGKPQGKVSSKQFYQFCKRIGASCSPANYEVESLFNSRLIGSVFKTKEYAFDAVILRDMMRKRLENVGVEISLNSEAKKVTAGNMLKVEFTCASTFNEVLGRNVFNCTYSMLNNVLLNSGVKLINLKNELSEICLISPPAELEGKSVTVMCGPFFSLMPYPPRNCYSLSHVRYTPHFEWNEGDKNRNEYKPAYEIFKNSKKKTWRRQMLNDATRYLPCLKDAKYIDSIWEVKTVLPHSEVDDSRPILFKQDYAMPSFHCILGGKIDNIYDVISVIKENNLI